MIKKGTVAGSAKGRHSPTIWKNRQVNLQFLPRRRPKKKEVIIHKDFAVPKATFTVIADPAQWREMKAMHRLDYGAP